MWLTNLTKTLTAINGQAVTSSKVQQEMPDKKATKEKTAKKKVGDWAEVTAKHYLEKNGLKFKACNYNCPLGEIDLIMSDKEQLVFIEVRFRKNSSHGDALDSIVRSKQNKVIKTAQHYLQEKNLIDKISCRFDVIGIQKDSDENPNIQWIKNAFY